MEKASLRLESPGKKSSKSIGYQVIGVCKGTTFPCFFCRIEFLCEGSLFAHLTTLRHLGVPNGKYQKNPEFECAVCGSDVPVENVKKHQCVEKVYKNYWEIIKFIDEFGAPNMCFLCRGMLFESPAHLNAHIISIHNWSEFDTGKLSEVNQGKHKSGTFICPICMASFNNDDMKVIHKHAFDEHVPEIGLQMLQFSTGFYRAKYGVPNDMKTFLANHIYSCFFPNFRVKRFPITRSKNINRTLPQFKHPSCQENCNTLINLTTHLCNYHFLLDLSERNNETATVNPIKTDMDNRTTSIKKEMEMRRRNLFERNIITNKIMARHYCLECFKIYDDELSLQIHYCVFHLNHLWYECSICQYNCKDTLRLTPTVNANLSSINLNDAYSENDKISPKLIWEALWKHERDHISYICTVILKQHILKEDFEINKNLLADMSDSDKELLEPVIAQTLGANNIKSSIKQIKVAFNDQEIDFLNDLAEKNKRKQTDAVIDEFLSRN